MLTLRDVFTNLAGSLREQTFNFYRGGNIFIK